MFYVVDKRNNHRLGPFTKIDAQKLARNLNDFIWRNANLAPKFFVERN
jgi:hypothetical protein